MVGVVELTGSGLVWVREVFVPDSVERSRGGDRRAYWTSGGIWGSCAWRNGEWIRIFNGGGVVGGVSGIRHIGSGRSRWWGRREGMENVKMFKGPFMCERGSLFESWNSAISSWAFSISLASSH